MLVEDDYATLGHEICCGSLGDDALTPTKDNDMKMRHQVSQGKVLPLSMLATEQYTIYPYVRGAGYPGNTMAYVYDAMLEEDVMPQVLYESEYHDLEAVAEYFSKTYLFCVTSPVSMHLLGCIWFSNILSYRANIGIWFRKYVRGTGIPDQAITRTVDYAFAVHGWQTVWGFSPWNNIVSLGSRTGFRHIGTLPKFVRVRGKLMDIHVMRKENV